MESLSFKKSEVLDKLRENREEHMTIIVEAQKGYRKEAIKLFSDKLTSLKAGEKVDVSFHLPMPASYVDEFDNAIQMLEMSVDEEVELTDDEFKCYIRNKWTWQTRFLEANSSYSGIANTLSNA